MEGQEEGTFCIYKTRRDGGQQRRAKESPVGLTQPEELMNLGNQKVKYSKKYIFGKEKSRKNVCV